MKRKTPFSVPEVQTVNVKHSETNTVLIYKNFYRMFEWKSDFCIGSQGWKLLEFSRIRARLHGGGGPQVGEVTRSGGVKTLPAFTRNLKKHAIPGYTSQDYWMVAKHVDKTNWRANDVFWWFCCSCCNFSELWLPIVTLMLQSLRQRQGYPTLTRLHGKIWPRLRELLGLAHWATRLCRHVTPPKRVTSPIWDPPPPC